MCLHTARIKVLVCIHTHTKRLNEHSRARAAVSPPAHLWPMLIWLDWIMVMWRGIWWVWGDALLLSFQGIVNWLGCFDVVVMREGGWWERLAKASYNSSPFYFWPTRDLCWRAVKRNETWWNQWEMMQICSCNIANIQITKTGETWAIFLFSPAERGMLSQLFVI